MIWWIFWGPALAWCVGRMMLTPRKRAFESSARARNRSMGRRHDPPMVHVISVIIIVGAVAWYLTTGKYYIH